MGEVFTGGLWVWTCLEPEDDHAWLWKELMDQKSLGGTFKIPWLCCQELVASSHGQGAGRIVIFCLQHPRVMKGFAVIGQAGLHFHQAKGSRGGRLTSAGSWDWDISYKPSCLTQKPHGEGVFRSGLRAPLPLALCSMPPRGTPASCCFCRPRRLELGLPAELAGEEGAGCCLPPAQLRRSTISFAAVLLLR